MKIYVCDICDHLIEEDDVNFIEINFDRFLERTHSVEQNIPKLDLCDECSRNLMNFIKKKEELEWRKNLKTSTI